ncbi:putative amidoligase enzyme-domain-containing protein [Achaetomium macrosporum]|uniref:Amidoligase enzyme-domain-containing protein n=1 Tax=Achaetomium macrosporum TaxID=79813 RepID=A0AAN7CGB9_9PEZI|nr:putative amidoligase enzyme-domain-containing protein [Achaetomium macrosporum]
MSSSRSARTAPSAGSREYLPHFGVEIEIYVKLLPHYETMIKEKQRRNPRSLPEYYQTWDFSLDNRSSDSVARLVQKKEQRERVGRAVEALIDGALGARNGWHCESDASLKEWQLTDPEDREKWWGIEIISPPTSVATNWQQDIRTVFEAVGERFDFWTNQCCATHVHVSPGPNKNSKYRRSELVHRAEGAYFWEEALCDLLPPERRNNRYALPNHTVYAGEEYRAVRRNGWAPVFRKLTELGAEDQELFLFVMKGGSNETRYLSTSFHPYKKYGTIELRRQAGSASATTVIHRVLLAVTLHVSGLRYDYMSVSRRSYPTSDELIKELHGCIKMLPTTCQRSRFINWLKWCVATYAGGYQPSEKWINLNERTLRKGGEYPTVDASSRGRPEGASRDPRSQPPAARRPPSAASSRSASRAPPPSTSRQRLVEEAWDSTARRHP